MEKKERDALADRRNRLRRDADMQRRLSDVEELARANRRELDLQFSRMAEIQVELDKLKKRQKRSD
jgi:hypothetical protein